MTSTVARALRRWPAQVVIVGLWCLHWLPFGLQDALARGVGRLLYRLAGARRRVALRNLQLCLPDLPEAEREAIARAHFRWLARSLLERGLLWFASAGRLQRHLVIEGDIGFAERHPQQPVMWLVPHFVGLEAAGTASQLGQRRPVVSMYQTQSNEVFDEAIRRGRLRFNGGILFSRRETARPLMRAIRDGHLFLNLPDMDFGERDAAFVPFFGVPAATLLAPSRMARALGMAVQPVVVRMRGAEHPQGAGWTVRFGEPWADFPTDDPVADAARMNRWIEDEVRANPAQYLWVHKRFKTRPPGQPSLYEVPGG
ncbi:lysophospholipid acyltransferase family protein [Aquabacterium sp. J223]|uniref:lysophospholipid acyltransferase family protein n=1 Tax=Aquabacterium sp. J223 TaxID=2898431 RepID=UPI0021AD8BFD|nr:lipid A biosynthesis acyltransferase [Aquabacterium sp. J223]UUX96481.1 lipid A biosynthesis acyltransferase [Aquabacterium sp. J223]